MAMSRVGTLAPIKSNPESPRRSRRKWVQYWICSYRQSIHNFAEMGDQCRDAQAFDAGRPFPICGALTLSQFRPGGCMSFKASTDHQLPASSSEEEEQAIEQLRKENSELRTELAMRTQENALLNEVISTVGSTLRLDEVLRHLVDTVVRATSCHIALIYLYDKEKERLV